MFANLLRIVRARAASKAVVVGVAAVSLVALAGGWAFASLGPGHATGSVGSLMSAAFHASGFGGRDTSQNGSQVAGPQVAGSQAGTPQSTNSQSAGRQDGATMPAGLLRATSQGLADVSRGDSPASEHSATGGGSTSHFHFGFTAQSHRNGNVAGTVTGNAEIVFGPPLPGHIHIDVNCLEIVGSDAFISGVSTNSAFGISKGTEFLLGVADDDSASKPDLISDIFFSPGPTPFTCHTFHAPPHRAVQGDIEIH